MWSSTRPIAPASSAAAAPCAPRPPSSMGGRCRTPPAPCWTRSSACAAGSGSRPGATARASSPPSSASRGRKSSTSPTSIVSRQRSSAPRSWRGRRPRSSSTTSASSPTRPTSSSAWPTGSCTPTRRCGRRTSLLAAEQRGAPGLWAHGISGDLPIVLARIDEAEDLDIVRQLLRAHEYWRLKLIDVDLVIINEHGATYAQSLHDALETLVRTSQSTLGHDGDSRHGAVYLVRGDRLAAEDRRCCRRGAGRAAEPPRRPRRPGRRAWSAPSGRAAAGSRRRRRRTPARAAPPRAGAGVLQRARRLRRRRPRIRHGPRAGPVDPGAVAQRDRQPVVRVPGLRIRVAATPGPATAARTSSRRGPTTRSATRSSEAIYVRDDDTRRVLGADGAADPRRRVDVRRAPRPGLQPLRAYATTASS